MLKSENYIPISRRNVAYGVVILLFTILIGKFYYLQIYQYDRYQIRAEYNRIRPVTTHAPRGVIFDRRGKILAANRSDYTISVIPAELRPKDVVINRISSYIGSSREVIEKNMKKYGRGRFLPARVARDISIEKLSILEEHKNDLPGVIYSELPVRLYPDKSGPRLSHVLGYLREVNDEDLNNIKDNDYSLGDFIGAQGLEKQYESKLKGEKGHLYYQVDVLGREVGLVPDRLPVPAIPGEDFNLTIDADLQAYTESLLEGYRASAVMINAKTGAVLTMVSKPDYSLEDFAGFINTDQWQQYITNPSRPLLNRATTGLYPPGSAMKIITAIAALENGLVDPNLVIECTGEYQYGDRTFGCWKPDGHGTVNLHKAIVESCNIYFYQLIQKMKIDQWYEIASQFGFGQLTGIDLPEEYAGIAPNKDYMDKKYGRRGWTKGYLLNIAIGQGDVLVTPLQMARFAALLAIKGENVQPWLVENPQESMVNGKENKVKLFRSTWLTIHKMVYDVINANDGTAYSSRILNRAVKYAGKTGTAENPHGEPHAWFIGFARIGDDIVAISVIIENGGHGGTISAPIATKMIKRYFGLDSLELTLK